MGSHAGLALEGLPWENQGSVRPLEAGTLKIPKMPACSSCRVGLAMASLHAGEGVLAPPLATSNSTELAGLGAAAGA